jgi:hypothetical protein
MRGTGAHRRSRLQPSALLLVSQDSTNVASTGALDVACFSRFACDLWRGRGDATEVRAGLADQSQRGQLDPPGATERTRQTKQKLMLTILAPAAAPPRRGARRRRGGVCSRGRDVARGPVVPKAFCSRKPCTSPPSCVSRPERHAVHGAGKQRSTLGRSVRPGRRRQGRHARGHRQPRNPTRSRARTGIQSGGT